MPEITHILILLPHLSLSQFASTFELQLFSENLCIGRNPDGVCMEHAYTHGCRSWVDA